MVVAFEIKATMHEINTTSVKVEMPLTTFFKVIYLTYPHYIESFQVSGQLKNIKFDNLAKKIEK